MRFATRDHVVEGLKSITRQGISYSVQMMSTASWIFFISSKILLICVYNWWIYTWIDTLLQKLKCTVQQSKSI